MLPEMSVIPQVESDHPGQIGARIGKRIFAAIQPDLHPTSDFTCAGSVVLLPKGMVRPAGNSTAIKAAFYMRYIELYGEEPLIDRSGF